MRPRCRLPFASLACVITVAAVGLSGGCSVINELDPVVGATGGGGGGIQDGGVLVIAGAENNEPTIVVLATADQGFPTLRETLSPPNPKALAYSLEHDEFYIWSGAEPDIPPAPNSHGTLHVRYFDDADYTWNDEGRLDDVPLPDRPLGVAVLRERLVYIAQEDLPKFVVIDIAADPPQLVGVFPLSLSDGSAAKGLLGAPTGPGPGGVVNVMSFRPDAAMTNLCHLQASAFMVDGMTAPQPIGTADIPGPLFACTGPSPSWTVISQQSTEAAVVFAPTPLMMGPGEVRWYQLNDPMNAMAGPKASFDMAGVQLGVASANPCDGTVLFPTGGMDKSVHAVSRMDGDVSVSLASNGSGAAFDWELDRVFVLSDGNIEAFEFDTANIDLDVALDWPVPNGLDARVGVTRSYDCE